MGVFDFLKTKASAAGRIMVMNPGRAQWTPRNYESFAKEGYQKNVVAYQAINRVADAVSTTQWELWQNDKLIENVDHPLAQLWARPNPYMSNGEFLRAVISYLLISGNSYPEAVTINGTPKEIWTHRPERMRVVPGGEGLPSAYVFSKDGRSVRWDVDPLTGRSDILHLKMFNPCDDWYGMSPLEAGAFAVDQHNESMTWMQALLQNSAQPSGALVMKEGNVLGAYRPKSKRTTAVRAMPGVRCCWKVGWTGRPCLWVQRTCWLWTLSSAARVIFRWPLVCRRSCLTYPATTPIRTTKRRVWPSTRTQSSR